MTLPQAGDWLGRYELLFAVAKGGMAEVWAAQLRGPHGFQKTVAIKTILRSGMDDVRMQQMFLEEATLASQIDHPNVVRTLELGEHEGVLYIVMEWLEGESLNFVMARAIARGGIPIPIAVNLIGQACKGLHAAHELSHTSDTLLGLVHRDISAQNILVTYSGIAKVVDFGVAKATTRATGLTEAGELRGKFAYMAPEQINAEEIDRRADIFSMGVLLYLATTGRHPFRGANPGETLRNICVKAPVAPSTLVAGYPDELEKVVLKALEKEPGERWATANDMLLALERAMPESFVRTFEGSVADYLKDLLGERASERRIKLRVAQEQADIAQSQSPPLSLGSLGGIAVDQKQALGSVIAPPVPFPQVMVEYSATHPSARAPRRRRNVVRAGWTAFALSSLLGVAVLGTKCRAARDVEPRAAAGAAMTANLSAIATSAELPLVVPIAPSSTAQPVSARDAVESAKDSKRGRKVELPSRSPAAISAPSSAPSAAAPVAAAPPSAAQQVPKQGREESSSNAWDPATFGGRR